MERAGVQSVCCRPYGMVEPVRRAVAAAFSAYGAGTACGKQRPDHAHSRPRCLLLIALLVAPFATEAEEGEEFVLLSSGNRMTGTVRALDRGELTFTIDGAGTVDIDWKNVETLQSEQRFDVELASGERLAGSIVAGAPGTVQLVTAAGPRTLERGRIVRITPVAATFLERTSGFIDAGFDFLSAGDEIDLTLNGEVSHRSHDFLTHMHVSSLVRRRDGETEQRRNHLELGTRRFLHDRWFVLGEIAAEEDLELELESRFLLAAGVGRALVQSNRTVLSVYGGLDYALEDYRGIPGSDDYAEALAAVEWDWFEVGGKTELLTEATTFFSLERSRTRIDLTASLRRSFFRSFYFSLNLFESYDSDPPADFENSDFGLSLTVGSTF
jgi:Protein of unknown function, DUF481.